SGGYMDKSELIYDNNYQSYYYLTAEGSYARNAWSGSYYFKSDGKMAKSEWIYDSSYQSYYYLTSEGSYARNTWVGDYY
ncbi:endo-beta-N-acetylglucosaminidase, partial [Streptococcus pneumoniae]|nr:endo-beta-N-acetylglucosaminidase [Streptococcus pneumoniae]